MKTNDIMQQFDVLAAEIKKLEETLKKVITEVVEEVSKENPHEIKRVGDNCFIVKASQLIGRPWNPSYYDWNAAGKALLEYLKKKDVKKWKSILQEKLDASKDESIEFESTITIDGRTWTNKTPLERHFIEKIVAKL